MSDKHIDQILTFFIDIGLTYQLTRFDDVTFLPGVKICGERLLIDLEKLTYPGDLLHEAGHIAITPDRQRHSLYGDMKKNGHQGGEEMAAIAWSWAALKRIGLPPEFLFHPEGYRGGSASLITAFNQSNGFGHPLLSSWFMCEPPNHPDGFPNMQRWFRDQDYIDQQLAKWQSAEVISPTPIYIK